MPDTQARSPIFLLAGMPRAGTAWCFEILTALIVASGGVDAREIRTKYKLEKCLTAGNAVVKLLLPDLFFLLRPWRNGEKFAVKTHDGPGTYPNRIVSRWMLKEFLARKIMLPMFIYRDPRDAVLSAYEYGKRQPETRGGAYFAKHIPTIEAGIAWMQRYLSRNWDAWVSRQGMLLIRYEDMVTDTDAQVMRMADYLGLGLPAETMAGIVEKFRHGDNPRRTHFHKGIAGRFREGFSAEQQKLANEAFGPYLEKMGYER